MIFFIFITYFLLGVLSHLCIWGELSCSPHCPLTHSEVQAGLELLAFLSLLLECWGLETRLSCIIWVANNITGILTYKRGRKCKAAEKEWPQERLSWGQPGAQTRWCGTIYRLKKATASSVLLMALWEPFWIFDFFVLYTNALWRSTQLVGSTTAELEN